MQVILDTIEYGAQIKKTPVVVGNCTGFAVNRVFFPYTQAACMLVDLGLDPYMIDMVILKGFGMPMGPFRCATCTLNHFIHSIHMLSSPRVRHMYCSQLCAQSCRHDGQSTVVVAKLRPTGKGAAANSRHSG